MTEAKVKEADNEDEAVAQPRRTFVWILALVVIAALSPSLITVTGQQRAVLGLAFPRLRDAINFESAPLHWWSPVEITNLTLKDLTLERDSESHPVVSVKQISIRQSLWSLAMSGGSELDLFLDTPEVNLRVDDGTTNLERTIEEIFGPGNTGGDRISANAEIENGVVRLFSNASTSLTEGVAIIDNINGRISTQSSGLLPTVSLTASIHQEQTNTVAESSAATRNQSGINPRIAADLELPAADHVLLPFTEKEIGEADVSVRPAVISIQVQPVAESQSEQQCVVSVHRIDLQRVQPLLQRFLPGSNWSGTMSCRIEGLITQAIGRGFAGRAFLLGDDVRFREASWAESEWIEFPALKGTAAVAVADDGVFIRELSLSSPVLRARGRGQIQLRTPDPVQTLKEASDNSQFKSSETSREAKAATAGTVHVDMAVDLAALSEMLPNTLHIGSDVEIREASLQVSCKLTSETPQANVQSLAQSPDGYRWQLAVTTSPIDARSAGQAIRLKSLLRIDADGSVSANSFSMNKVKMAGAPGELTVTPMDSEFLVAGRIQPQQLWQELNGLIDIPQPQISGPIDLVSHVKFEPDAVVLTDSELNSSDLSVTSKRLVLRESAQLLNKLQGHVSLNGQAAALRTLIAPWHELSWLTDSTAVSAQLEIAAGERISVRAAVEPGQTIGPDKRTKASDRLVIPQGILNVDLRGSQTVDSYDVEKAFVRLPGITANGTGSLSFISGVPETDLNIETQYDLETLFAWLIPSAKDTLHLSGRRTAVFKVSGSPTIISESASGIIDGTGRDDFRSLTISGSIGWDSGRLLGLPVGPAATTLQLQNGIIRSDPIRCSIGSGNLNALMQWDTSSNVLQLASGSRIQNLQLTPEFCRKWMGYIAPMLSDSANVSGQLSARVQHCEIPVDAMESSRIRGIVDIHQATAAPGESLLPLLQVLEVVRKRPLSDRQIALPEQQVAVQIEHGQVTHDRIETDIAGYRTISSGTVGLDKQIRLTLDVPLERSSEDRRGRSIRVPVGGTVGRPQIQIQGLLQNLGQQKIRDRVDNEIDRGINRLLDKLR